ncbi:DUF4352 domain-containing protein [Mobilicoccus pelagius]|uniref:DUF4352 domain-containing protein n=1 Tax=Mobilicoccus pelagius NBRC 104925 TaxID=1089455 RepID=H5UQV7_9MICO|nr:DUF4352 domain-containing protein [Mobilicoccus pelagius]GAB48115.1 hypothetical protein MOPEL_060_00320 [Mobilicoccus pelagius NBRC 104925]
MTTVAHRPTPVRVPVPQDHHNGLGIAGLVLGIIGALVCAIPLIGLLGVPLALVALVLSLLGVMRAHSGAASNFGIAAAGLVLSVAALGFASFWFSAAMLSGIDPTGASTEDVMPLAFGTFTESETGSSAIRTVPKGEDLVVGGMLSSGKASFVVDDFAPTVKGTDSWMVPSPGNKYVAAHVSVENLGKGTYENISWIGAKVYSSDGQGYPSFPLVASNRGPALPDTIDLKPDSKVDGWLVFEVPADATVSSVVLDDAEWTL